VTRVKFERLVLRADLNFHFNWADEGSDGAIDAHTHFTDNTVRVALNYQFH
jgi:hypothetical protein